MNDIISEKHWSEEIPAVGDRFVPRSSNKLYIQSARVVAVAEGYVMYEATAADDGHTFMDVLKISTFNYAYIKTLFLHPVYVNIYDMDWHHYSLESANHCRTLYPGERLGVLFLLLDGTTGFLSENEALRG